ncbi:hypothetical protein FDZ71_06835 [bacterium]|nr:MAG: hypothetical protein FDZ71_06835 [bacterium]
MIEKIGPVRNPLTTIAIFAAIAEVSGTVVLPFVTEGQGAFVWFLIAFPTLLVLLFFATLNFNPKVLYAPSDYRNEDNFLRTLKGASSAARAQKVEQEVREIQVSAHESGEQSSDPNTPTAGLPWDPEDSDAARARYLLAEELVFQKLADELFPLHRNVELLGVPDYLFDAVGFSRDRRTTAVEVKYLATLRGIHKRLPEIVRELESRTPEDSEYPHKRLRVLLVIVTDESPVHFDPCRDYDPRVLETAPFPIEVRAYNLAELQAEAWGGRALARGST